jgi:dolichol-phosphate mannosyltransferase
MMYYFLIPVFNEEPNLLSLKQGLINAASGTNKFYVFVDDGSTDNSVAVLKEILKDHDHIVLGDGLNHGPGAAFNSGFEWILDHSKDPEDRIITLEGDNTSSLEILEKMLKISEAGFDLVLASVYAQGGGFDQTNIFRKVLSFIANMLFRLLFNIKILTLSSFYRVYKVSLIQRVKNKYRDIITEKGFICMLEILLKAIRVDASIIEVPMKLYSKKRIGKSKMKIFKTSLGYLKFLVLKGRQY